MDSSEAYTPINCSFYDYLEEAATLKQVATIVYLNEGVTEIVEARIKTLFIKNKVEYMLLENNQEIRLDKLISFNGKQLPHRVNFVNQTPPPTTNVIPAKAGIPSFIAQIPAFAEMTDKNNNK